MSEIKTLEDMRNTVKTIAADCDEGWILGCLDAIESEIAERYMELPVDADGVPIRVGDELEYVGYVMNVPNARVVGVSANGIFYRDERHCELLHISANEYRHVKQRTIEDILALFLTAVGDDDPHYYDEQIAECAAEIRELMGVSAND